MPIPRDRLVALQRPLAEQAYEYLAGRPEQAFDLAEIRQSLLEWERIYNTIRPHQALGYLTPLKFLQQKERRQVSLII